MNNADEPINAIFDKYGDVSIGSGGLTKREHFAAMAMQGLLASSDAESALSDADWYAEAATRLADALLAELDK